MRRRLGLRDRKISQIMPQDVSQEVLLTALRDVRSKTSGVFHSDKIPPNFELAEMHLLASRTAPHAE